MDIDQKMDSIKDSTSSEPLDSFIKKAIGDDARGSGASPIKNSTSSSSATSDSLGGGLNSADSEKSSPNRITLNGSDRDNKRSTNDNPSDRVDGVSGGEAIADLFGKHDAGVKEPASPLAKKLDVEKGKDSPQFSSNKNSLDKPQSKNKDLSSMVDDSESGSVHGMYGRKMPEKYKNTKKEKQKVSEDSRKNDKSNNALSFLKSKKQDVKKADVPSPKSLDVSMVTHPADDNIFDDSLDNGFDYSAEETLGGADIESRDLSVAQSKGHGRDKDTYGGARDDYDDKYIEPKKKEKGGLFGFLKSDKSNNSKTELLPAFEREVNDSLGNSGHPDGASDGFGVSGLTKPVGKSLHGPKGKHKLKVRDKKGPAKGDSLVYLVVVLLVVSVALWALAAYLLFLS